MLGTLQNHGAVQLLVSQQHLPHAVMHTYKNRCETEVLASVYPSSAVTNLMHLSYVQSRPIEFAYLFCMCENTFI